MQVRHVGLVSNLEAQRFRGMFTLIGVVDVLKDGSEPLKEEGP